jgi:hypothetical protein
MIYSIVTIEYTETTAKNNESNIYLAANLELNISEEIIKEGYKSEKIINAIRFIMSVKNI